jgi:hypothetical protein
VKEADKVANKLQGTGISGSSDGAASSGFFFLFIFVIESC